MLKTELSDSGLFIADKHKAVLLAYDYNELWSALMPLENNNPINQIIYLTNDYFVLCFKNWAMNAYHTSQKTGNSKSADSSKTVLKNEQFDYSSFAPLNLSEFNYYSQGSFFNDIKDPKIPELISSGEFGVSEAQLLTQTLSIARLYALYVPKNLFLKLIRPVSKLFLFSLPFYVLHRRRKQRLILFLTVQTSLIAGHCLQILRAMILMEIFWKLLKKMRALPVTRTLVILKVSVTVYIQFVFLWAVLLIIKKEKIFLNAF